MYFVSNHTSLQALGAANLSLIFMISSEHYIQMGLYNMCSFLSVASLARHGIINENEFIVCTSTPFPFMAENCSVVWIYYILVISLTSSWKFELCLYLNT